MQLLSIIIILNVFRAKNIMLIVILLTSYANIIVQANTLSECEITEKEAFEQVKHVK